MVKTYQKAAALCWRWRSFCASRACVGSGNDRARVPVTLTVVNTAPDFVYGSGLPACFTGRWLRRLRK